MLGCAPHESKEQQEKAYGEATFASIFAGIDSARDYVLVQFYIVRDGELGRELKSRMIRGVVGGVSSPNGKVTLMRKPLTLLPGALLIALSATGAGQAQDTWPQGGVNLLDGAEVAYSVDGGATFSSEPPTIGPREVITVFSKVSFRVPEAVARLGASAWFSSLTLRHEVNVQKRSARFRLNEREIDVPLEGMVYRTIPGIDPGLLEPGENTLTTEMVLRNPSRNDDSALRVTVTLAPLTASDLRFQTGPLLGAFDQVFFTVTARTNMPARVSVYRAGEAESKDDLTGMERLARTEMGLVHRLRVQRRAPEGPAGYRVIAERDGFTVGTTVKPPALPDSSLRFLVIGDTRTNIAEWQQVATAAAESRASLVVHIGDMVTSGTRDWEWDTQFWLPGRVLLEDLPFYPVIGNHEANAPLFDRIYLGPGDDGGVRNWSQELNGVLLIGIDGAQDWSPGSANVSWLEETLSASRASFVFLFGHYPGFSSAPHGRLDESGVPIERPSKEARETVLPLLTRYGATAMIAGHDHVYERSELPGGVTAVTCGGGGAPLYRRTEDAARQNPHSKLFSRQHHFCALEVNRYTAALRAVASDGELIDSRTWQPRKR